MRSPPIFDADVAIWSLGLASSVSFQSLCWMRLFVSSKQRYRTSLAFVLRSQKGVPVLTHSAIFKAIQLLPALGDPTSSESPAVRRSSITHEGLVKGCWISHWASTVAKSRIHALLSASDKLATRGCRASFPGTPSTRSFGAAILASSR